jgi:WhiB family redox-sensing transcriptional regulator
MSALDPITPEPKWELANCIGVNPDVFFLDVGENGVEAKRICAACHIRKACLDYAVHKPEYHGIWGGKSAKQRRLIRNGKDTVILNRTCRECATQFIDERATGALGGRPRELCARCKEDVRRESRRRSNRRAS